MGLGTFTSVLGEVFNETFSMAHKQVGDMIRQVNKRQIMREIGLRGRVASLLLGMDKPEGLKSDPNDNRT
ncbi:MAG: hypothetical protein ABGX43_04510, partial [Nitrospinaceae bacterium]|nr:hypothetical protein [Nitrospinaceae bacterium]